MRTREEINYEIYDELVRLGERFRKARRDLPVFHPSRTRIANEYFVFSREHESVIDWALAKKLKLPK